MDQWLGFYLFFSDFGLAPDLESNTIEDASRAQDAPQPLGMDFGFSPESLDLIFSADGDLVLMGEISSLAQWLWVSLFTQRGTELVYTPRFGSDLVKVLAAGFPIGGPLEEQVSNAVETAVAAHDRIDRLESLLVFPVTSQDEPLYFTATVVVDDAEILTFEGAR